jgi:hypothetical protein
VQTAIHLEESLCNSGDGNSFNERGIIVSKQANAMVAVSTEFHDGTVVIACSRFIDVAAIFVIGCST